MSKKEIERESAFVPALEKSLNILEFLTLRKAVTVQEIVAALGIPSTTVFRIVKHLCSRGYLKEEAGEQAVYRLGPQIYVLYHSFVAGQNTSALIREALDRLSDACGQTAQYAVLKSDGILYTEQSLPTQPVSIIAPLQTLVPVNISAAGKVLTAALPGKERAGYVAACTLVHNTEKSITDRAAFARELETVAVRGYGVDDEEFAAGIGCLAAPVYNYTGQVTGAIGITGHIRSYRSDFETLARTVQDAAELLSEKLGYTKA